MMSNNPDMNQPTVGVRFVVEISGGDRYQIGSAVMSEANWRTELPDALRQLADYTRDELACLGSEEVR